MYGKGGINLFQRKTNKQMTTMDDSDGNNDDDDDVSKPQSKRQNSSLDSFSLLYFHFVHEDISTNIYIGQLYSHLHQTIVRIIHNYISREGRLNTSSEGKKDHSLINNPTLLSQILPALSLHSTSTLSRSYSVSWLVVASQTHDQDRQTIESASPTQ